MQILILFLLSVVEHMPELREDFFGLRFICALTIRRFRKPEICPSALSSARSYYESRFSGGLGFDQRDRDALEIVALVDRVGYRGDRKN
jgi:hypothetical protein